MSNDKFYKYHVFPTLIAKFDILNDILHKNYNNFRSNYLFKLSSFIVSQNSERDINASTASACQFQSHWIQ